ncbi:hypothetical protein H1R16_07245 [Marnyiella aurantia]|uniref:Outer membrane beta-barrel protein n=1 Tax=Marnyiella aurantia TaxID=2758037 RepID=A0A7D7QJI8_9FLAO|nr:DUF6646 family protein [Marnyiella aurantia]MBA5247146.1 hypothetical protein [Marnyiella aurantia]QMS97525.1 hypothetical protein H1R16_07245 [Marnyiella aurantia]
MKKLILTVAVAAFGFAGAQSDNDAFRGPGDLRVNVGANFQAGGTGIAAMLDYGLGESFSVGAQAGYLLGVEENLLDGDVKAEHRFDAKARVSAHLGDVIGLPQNFDIYPGLNLGLKNFGGHAGVRYFFDKGFGVFAETQFPIAKYNTEGTGYRRLNNQFAFLIGASFDLGRRGGSVAE